MPRMIGSGLSRREREIMEILHRVGKATATEVMEAMPDPPTYSAVRSILRVLQEKGHIRHEEEGKRYLYLPVEAQNTAARSALRSVLQNFFGGSLESAVKTFLSDTDVSMSQEELARMAEVIEQARKSEEE
ncbi:MAG TPA: BlaI/MecI/CopY family transcriptional regulator [Chthonomonadaceae bacterium]|nr:BlaI/MecI/CopY family transcriptional regulator [Chthonomonadaceae bacterium]